MRNIICTSLAGLSAPALALTCATAAEAEEPMGCFARTYSAAHLARHPDQVVAKMVLDFEYDPANDIDGAPPGARGAALDVVLARQGHVVRDRAPDEGFPNGFGGARMNQVLVCADRAGRYRCTTPCGLGGFEVTKYDGYSVVIRTATLPVGQGQDCGGYADIAEYPGKPVSYLLKLVPSTVCERR